MTGSKGALPIQTEALEYLPWDDPEFELNPYPWYEVVLREAPVLLDESGTYVVSRFDDIMEFARNRCMSVEPGWDRAGAWAIVRQTIIGRDDPDHTRLRRQTNRWFTPKLVKTWVEVTASVTHEILDAMEGDRIDGWHDLSVIPTHRTMCRVLQVPDEGWEPVKRAMARSMPMLSARPRNGTPEMAQESFRYLAAKTEENLDHACATHGDGLIHELVAAQKRGEITSDEMRATALAFYSLGHMDVGYSIASGLRIFAEFPDVFQLFRDKPEMRDAIVNEIIRYDPPELSFYRTPMEDITIRGVNIPAGSTVRFLLAAANRDPAVFENPQTFNPRRSGQASRNLSFGIGTHSCAGQVIARAEARAVFEVVAQRYSGVELAGAVVMENTDFSRHFEKLPLRLLS